jgi:pectate lyase C
MSLVRILPGVLLLVTACDDGATQAKDRDPFGQSSGAGKNDAGQNAGGSSGDVTGPATGGSSTGDTAAADDDAGSDGQGSTGGNDDDSSGGDAGSSGGVDAGSSGNNTNNGSSGASNGSTTGGGDDDGPITIGTGGTVNATILVKSGETFDGGGKRYIAGPALGDGSQSESQSPVFKLEDGARLINVVLGAPAADGIHTHGDATLKNIVWEDIGEDALTIKESGTVVLDGGSASKGEDKVFQINAASVFKVSNFKASDAGKFIRQNGGTTFKVEVFIDACEIVRMSEAVFRTDSSTSTVSMTNTRYSAIGESLFIGVTPSNIQTANNTEF